MQGIDGLRQRLKPLSQTTWVKAIFASCLVFALFGGGFWQVCNFPDDPSNAILDVTMCVVFLLFIIEIFMNIIVDRSYCGSFFFWMDILGTGSMVFEISFLFGSAGQINENDTAIDPVIMRTARVAKTAARAGRFLKLTKCLEIIVKRRNQKPDAKAQDTAKTLSAKLMLTLSTKVSLLTILLVIIVPVFQIGQYPEEDLSMKAWGQRLEDTYRHAYDSLAEDPDAEPCSIDTFAAVVLEMRDFYSSVDYFPYQLDGYSKSVDIGDRKCTISGENLLAGEEVPVRAQNIVKQEVSKCDFSRPDCTSRSKAAVFFNFQASKRLEAGMEMSMSVFVIAIMALLTSELSQTIDRLVVKPLGRMLHMVRELASTIMNMTEANNGEGEEADWDGNTPDETELLERAFDKLSKISSIALQEKKVSAKDMQGMTNEAKGVMVDLMMMEQQDESANMRDMRNDAQYGTQVVLVSKQPVSKEIMESWRFDTLSLSEADREQCVLYLLFDTAIGSQTGRQFTEANIFQAFYESAMQGYTDQPYHNAMHAVDILHTVYRLLGLTLSDGWCSAVEQYALLVAALCHDIGHMGKTNPFLVETGHDLALQYNDASPLENMHCASLFKICSNANTDVFKGFPTDSYRQARKVCVATILHTDNANHFEMVKDLNRAYEVSSELCDKQARTTSGLLPNYEKDVLKRESLLYLELFLHFADVSNPLKPFDLCLAWAWRVLEEFFAQGDEEKRLGIPVGMLNDRDKVSKPGSQHGFINFLVAPLVFASVKIFPNLHPLSTQMAANLLEWRNIWVNDTPDADEEAINKRDADVQKVNQTAVDLQKRCLMPVDTRIIVSTQLQQNFTPPAGSPMQLAPVLAATGPGKVKGKKTDAEVEGMSSE